MQIREWPPDPHFTGPKFQLQSRTYNALLKYNILTLEQLRAYTAQGLIGHLNNIGIYGVISILEQFKNNYGEDYLDIYQDPHCYIGIMPLPKTKHHSITENKLHHSISVARECAYLAKEHGMNESQIRAAFLMGLLHDIGYEYLPDDAPISEHPAMSVQMIDDMLAYITDIREAIATHGTCTSFPSEFSYILNEADLRTSYDGNTVSIEERLQGIIDHHGADSEHAKHAQQMAELIKNTTKGD